MISLFEEIKNPLFGLVCQLVNEIQAGAKLTRRDLVKRIRELKQFNYNEAPDFEREEEIIDLMFEFSSSDGYAKNHLEAPIPNLITSVELSWLKTMLMDSETSFVVAEDLRDRLLKKLEDIPSLYSHEMWQRLRFKSNQIAAGIKHHRELSMIVTALRERKAIRCMLGENEKTILPCRLEYDLFNDKYFLIVWNEQFKHIERVSIEDLKSISLTKIALPEDIEKVLQNFYQAHSAEISLQVRNTRNAVERCFELFGSYDKRARIQNDGTYFLMIKYYDFEEEEIIERILSLGAAVTVIEPQKIRERIIQRLVEIRELYK